MVEYHKSSNVDIRIARIFNTYGPNMDKNDGRVVSNFINQCINNNNITIYGEGLQTRSFCYVSDMVDGLIKLMNSEKYVGPINLGNPNEITIKQLADIVKEKTNSKSKIIFNDLPQDDPIKRQPNIDKAKQILNWEPNVSLDTGLRITIDYFIDLNI